MFFLSLFSCNFDDQKSTNFHRFVILSICWDKTPSVRILVFDNQRCPVPFTHGTHSNCNGALCFFCGAFFKVPLQFVHFPHRRINVENCCAPFESEIQGLFTSALLLVEMESNINTFEGDVRVLYVCN